MSSVGENLAATRPSNKPKIAITMKLGKNKSKTVVKRLLKVPHHVKSIS